MDNNKELRGKVALLESRLDLLESELCYLNDLLLRCGFSQGLNTLKMAVEEILAEEVEENF